MAKKSGAAGWKTSNVMRSKERAARREARRRIARILSERPTHRLRGKVPRVHSPPQGAAVFVSPKEYVDASTQSDDVATSDKAVGEHAECNTPLVWQTIFDLPPF